MLRSVFTVFSRSESSIFAGMRTSSLFVSDFFTSRSTVSPEGETGVAGLYFDFIITRFLTNAFSCVSVRVSPLLELGTPVIVVSDGSPCTSSSSSGSALVYSSLYSGTSGASGRRTRGFRCKKDVHFCGLSATARRFSSAQLSSCTSCAHSFVSSDRMFFFLHEDEKESPQDECVNQPADLAQAYRASRNTSSTEGASPPAGTGHRSNSEKVNARAALQAKIALHRLK